MPQSELHQYKCRDFGSAKYFTSINFVTEMDQHKLEGQHRLSRTYLGHWSYEHEGKSCVFIFHKKDERLEDKPIADYTIAHGEFDIPSEDEKIRRHYERTAAWLENRYNTIIRTITNQDQLISIHEDMLKNFASLFLCRSEAVRAEFIEVLKHPDARDGFLEMICS